MGNTFFRFKQFTVHQRNNAMKVCTDSCLFGAWTPLPDSGRVLDIGTGTGLIALMAAQRTGDNVRIDAVELQQDAAAEALENSNASPWHKRIEIHQGDFLDRALTVYRHRYEAIVSNPPFYDHHMLPPQRAYALAHHQDTLPLSELLSAASKLLTPSGTLSLLLPFYYRPLIEGLLHDAHLYLHRDVAVCNTLDSKPIRLMLTAGSAPPHDVMEDKIVIYNHDGKTYTNAFATLLHPFYLYL